MVQLNAAEMHSNIQGEGMGWRQWLMQSWPMKNFSFVVIIAALFSTIVTYALITGSVTPLTASEGYMRLLVIANLAVLLLLVGIVCRRIYGLWVAFRQGAPGTRLQTRIVALFSLVTILPTILVSIFSAIFFNIGIQAWFNDRVNTVLEESLAVAETYLNEHKENLRGDALAMANDLDKEAGEALTNPVGFNNLVAAQAALRSLSEVIVFHRNRIIAQGPFSFSLAFEQLQQSALERADSGEVVMLNTGEDVDKVRALIRLSSLPETYLLVGRLVDSKVLNHMDNTQGTVREYKTLKKQIARLQVMFSIVFVTLALLLLLAAVWYGMGFASKLITPISRLVVAAERVRAGDFSAKVVVASDTDEIATLARAFNRMTDQLEAQRSELMEVNRRLDERRRFTEAVLAGVSAGVVAIDRERKVSLHNRSALSILLGKSEEALEGKPIDEVVPGVARLLTQAEQKPAEVAQDTFEIRRGGETRTLHVRVSVEHLGDWIEGFIVTFDDITMLVSAQRSAAWSDVARRVAHEIKNPLTPIQLAAERLKRKYLKLVGEEEAESFTKYTETITRHVADIGRIVEEFVNFARMPTPVFARQDLAELVRAAVFSQQTANPNIDYIARIISTPAEIMCDERQIAQVLTNLLKNAAEAIESGEEGKKGEINIALQKVEGGFELEIGDNGPGFPTELIQKLFEPYVTTRTKGTGLGMAIVKKIIDDHKGKIMLSNKDEGGARVTLFFSIDSDIKAAA